MALAWCFPDEGNEYADRVLIALEGYEACVPAIWGMEIANAMLAGERRKRLKPSDLQEFLLLLGELSIRQDVVNINENVHSVLPLARTHRLSAYDAAYLELALRYGAPLATLDVHLSRAAKQAGVARFF